MPETYAHLTLEERALMQVWIDHNLSLRPLARKLRRAPSTITREFARNNWRPPDQCMAPAPGRPAIAVAYRCGHAQQRAELLAKKPCVAHKMIMATPCATAFWSLCAAA